MNHSSQVLFTFISLTVLLLVLIYNSYCTTPLFTVNKHISDINRSTNFVLKQNKWMTSQGLQCEDVSYVKSDDIQLGHYWKILNKYKLYHEEGVRRLNKGDSSSVRTLTWHCGTDLCGGLGFRIYGITMSLLFAMLSDRVLLLKWDRISAENTHLLPNEINWKYPNHTLSGSFNDLGSFRNVPFRDLLVFRGEMIQALTGNTLHVQMLYNRLQYLNEVVSQLNTKFNKSEEHIALSQKKDIFLFHLVSFKFLFRISEELKLFASEARNKLNLHTQKYVALHVRTGDFIDERGKKDRFMDSEKELTSATQCAIKQAEQHIGPNGTVIVVSDSASVKWKLAKTDQRIKVFDNVIVHVDKEELDESGMLGTWQDIIIMAEAHIIVYGHSSFPELSIAICGVPKSRVVHYKSCYVNDGTNTATIPL